MKIHICCEADFETKPAETLHVTYENTIDNPRMYTMKAILKQSYSGGKTLFTLDNGLQFTRDEVAKNISFVKTWNKNCKRGKYVNLHAMQKDGGRTCGLDFWYEETFCEYWWRDC